MPILGVVASGISGNLDSSAYFPIATTTLTTATSTVTFSSIPATYTHLQIRFLIQSNRASANSGDFAGIRFNSDTGTNYVAGHQLSGDGASATSYFNGASVNYIYLERIGNYETDANAFTGGVIDILDYGNTNKYKTMRTLIGYSTNTVYTQVNFVSGAWMSSTAISSISLTMLNGQHTQYSSYALYGIKG